MKVADSVCLWGDLKRSPPTKRETHRPKRKQEEDRKTERHNVRERGEDIGEEMKVGDQEKP